MKKIIICLLSGILISCDTENKTTDLLPVVFTAHIRTKSTVDSTHNLYKRTFENGDKIDVFSSSDPDPRTLTLTEGRWQSKVPLYISDLKPATQLTAYWPAGKSQGSEYEYFYRETAEGCVLNDILKAVVAVDSIKGQNIRFRFSHRNALLSFTFDGVQPDTLSSITIAVDEDVTGKPANRYSHLAAFRNEKNVFEALVPGNGHLLSVTLTYANRRQQTFHVNRSLSPNTHYPIILTRREAKIALITDDILSWSVDPEENTAQETHS